MNPVYTVFVYIVWFLATFFMTTLLLMLLLTKNKLYETKKSKLKRKPLVSIVVPAYNEEGSIANTICSLKRVNYPKLEFIIVNDGSKDRTSSIVRKEISDDERFVFIDRKRNKGKAASLNEGIRKARGELIATIDADSEVEPEIINKVLPYFNSEKVGAVTVSVEVNKPKGFLHRIIDLEYVLGLSLFLKVLSIVNCIYVTPGPCSIYKASALRKIKGFDENNITEDFEIAFRLRKAGYRITNCIEAKVCTKVPPTFKQVYVQRRRWYTGTLQTIIKHRDMILNKKYGIFAYFLPLNYSLILLGLALFIYTTYLGFSNILENILYFRYTNFNFLDRLFDWQFDYLAYNDLSLFGILGFLTTIVVMLIGLKIARKSYKEKKWGMLGYPCLYFLYQIFWISAIINVIKGGKIKWK